MVSRGICLLVAEAGQRPEPGKYFLAVGLAGFPDPVGPAVVVLDDVLGERVDPARHDAAVAVDRGLLDAQFDELVEIGLGDPADVEARHPFGDLPRADERDLHGDLLVQEHAGEQGERVVREECVGFGVAGEAQARCHGGQHLTPRPAPVVRTRVVRTSGPIVFGPLVLVRRLTG